ncbi:MAG: glycosyltransferase family 2 protein [Verrucomicrobiae bacterium]|nr:glycosyltransferase family 2 protein [Verrucomicrobiae bacterium]MCX7722256.1 glycosyltransferase family 2 protein [Verrucomicrobiae bacterium]MDW7980814.1 glycosyltransferase family 2 protein [Verrucomicrobiales bacterium]
MNPLPVSVCMVAGAEAHRIGRALESVAGWVSEIIVVVNEEVTDGTDRIATNYGAKVFREPWKGFVAQKNSASAKGTQPWLLLLDADEAVSSNLRDEIVRTLLTPGIDSVFAAFSFPRCTWFCGRWIRHGDWYPDRQTRLWRRGKGTWEGIDCGGFGVHSKLRVEGRIGRLKGELLHYTATELNKQVPKYMMYADHFAKRSLLDNRPVRTVEILFRPWWRFTRSYILRLGFLDGWQGLAVAWLVAFGTFLRYARAKEELCGKPHPQA